jgi:hypothetical protein
VNMPEGTTQTQPFVDPRSKELEPIDWNTLKYKSLQIFSREEFEKTLEFARERGIQERLFNTIDRLEQMYKGRYRSYGKLWYDNSPHSFMFCLQENGLRDGPYHLEPGHLLTGLMIYQSPSAPAHGGAPYFSVSIDPCDEEGWSVRT